MRDEVDERPMRAIPIASCMSPMSSARVSASFTYSGVPGVASGAIVAKTASDSVFVGPDI
jgi:hypothetical protein